MPYFFLASPMVTEHIDAALRQFRRDFRVLVSPPARTEVYMAARPTHGTDVFVGDPEVLAEVRWVTPRQADELMGGQIYEPVRAHLRQTFDEGLPVRGFT